MCKMLGWRKTCLSQYYYNNEKIKPIGEQFDKLPYADHTERMNVRLKIMDQHRT